MSDMPRPRPPHLHREVTRHGHVVWFVRINKGRRIRIRGEYGTPEFMAAYHAAISGKALSQIGDNGFPAKSFGWLIEQYRQSTTWAALSNTTRRQREGIFRDITRTAGREPYSRIDSTAVERGISRRKPNAAQHFLDALRGLFKWAFKHQYIDSDPTIGVKAVRPPSNGYAAWPQEWCDRFEAHWPRGTRQRVAYDVFIYRPHVKNGIATIRTEKSGGKVILPILPPLQATLDAGPVGELTFIAGENGKPIKKQSCANMFREACRAAGVPGSPHGLRKAAATRAADNGATEAELEALFGWRGGHMASLYTRTANRSKLAMGAANKLLSERDANIYSRTLSSVRDLNEKK